jgi:hypothetical protein
MPGHPALDAGSQSITIYNIFGESVLTEILRPAQDDKVIDLSNQPSGVYLYRVINPDGTSVGEGKLIIQK